MENNKQAINKLELLLRAMAKAQGIDPDDQKYTNNQEQLRAELESELPEQSSGIEVEAAKLDNIEQQPKSVYGANNKIITTVRNYELCEKVRDKPNNLNVGFDPEVFYIGTQMAMFHIEAGSHKFADFAKRMVDDLGDAIRPFLKASYEGARAMPGMEELSKRMDPYKDVVAFDVNQSFDEAKKMKKIYCTKENPWSLIIEMEESRKPKRVTEVMFREELQRLVDKAVEEGENPVHQAIDHLRMADLPTLPDQIVDSMMLEDPGLMIFKEIEGMELVEAPDEIVEEYKERTFLHFLTEVVPEQNH